MSASNFMPLSNSSTATASISSPDTSAYGFQAATRHWDSAPVGVAPELVSSRQRSFILLGTPHGTPVTDAIARHAMHFVTRVLLSWARMMAANDTSRFPPMIHHLQLANGLPVSLANCCTLAKMWFDKNGNRELVGDMMIQEVNMILRAVCYPQSLPFLLTFDSTLLTPGWISLLQHSLS
jgi:hypothetical protein